MSARVAEVEGIGRDEGAGFRIGFVMNNRPVRAGTGDCLETFAHEQFASSKEEGKHKKNERRKRKERKKEEVGKHTSETRVI